MTEVKCTQCGGKLFLTYILSDGDIMRFRTKCNACGKRVDYKLLLLEVT
jgi:endogenous inhibitor of DNA gyrase (YacG/DUF329 family)